MEFDYRAAGLCFSSLGLIFSAAVLITSRYRSRAFHRIGSNLDKIHDDLQSIEQGIYKIESRDAKDITPSQSDEPKQLFPPE